MSYTLAYTGAEIDALLGKIDAIFVAEYGSTIYSEVTAAIAAGNKVIVANAGKVFVYAGTDDNDGYVFTQSGPNAAKPNATYVTLSTGNVWSTNSVDLATLQQFYASLMEDTASGSIASFPDGAENVPVKELSAEIEPIQDLHGYSNPWPAGGNVNKFDLTTFDYRTNHGITFARDGNDIVISGTSDGNDDAYLNFSSLSVGGTGEKVRFIIKAASANSAVTLRAVGSTSGESHNMNLSSAEVSSDFTYANENYYGYLKVSVGTSFSTPFRVQVFAATYTGTAPSFSPYANECPIYGYTGAEINVTGINVWDEQWEFGIYSDSTGQPSSNSTRIRSKNNIRVKSGASYYIYCGVLGGAFNGFWLDENGGYIEHWNATNQVVTVPENAKYMKFYIGAVNQDGYHDNVSINITPTDTSYHAYNPDSTTYSVDWTDEGTVYHGLLSYIGNRTWKLKADYGKVDMGDLTWSNWTTSGGNYRKASSALQNAKSPSSLSTLANIICSMYKGVTAQATYEQVTGIAITTTGVAVVYDPNYNLNTDTTAFTTAVTGQTLLYELATPIEYTLTADDVLTLLGQNNIFSSTGDVDVRYRCNTALYIEKMLSGNTQQALSMSPRQQTQELNVPTLGKTISTDIGSFEAEHPELDELTEEPELEPYDEPEEEQPEELTEDEPEAEAEPEEELTEELEAEPEEEPAEAPEEA